MKHLSSGRPAATHSTCSDAARTVNTKAVSVLQFMINTQTPITFSPFHRCYRITSGGENNEISLTFNLRMTISSAPVPKRQRINQAVYQPNMKVAQKQCIFIQQTLVIASWPRITLSRYNLVNLEPLGNARLITVRVSDQTCSALPFAVASRTRGFSESRTNFRPSPLA